MPPYLLYNDLTDNENMLNKIPTEEKDWLISSLWELKTIKISVYLSAWKFHKHLNLIERRIPEGNTDHCKVSCLLQDQTKLSAFHSEVNHQISFMDEVTMD